eukprot:gene3747-7439_t
MVILRTIEGRTTPASMVVQPTSVKQGYHLKLFVSEGKISNTSPSKNTYANLISVKLHFNEINWKLQTGYGSATNFLRLVPNTKFVFAQDVKRSLSYFKGGFSRVNRSPRIQSVYDTISSVNDIFQSLKNPLSCESIIACMDAMNDITLEDVGIDLATLKSLRYSACMKVCSTPTFDIAVFLLPAGSKIPLHDHPNMTVLTKLISGDLKTRAFTATGEKMGNFISATTSSIRRTASDKAWLLTPTEGNIHEFYAETPCVIFDVLLPPYDDPDRPCTYYCAEEVAEGRGTWYLSPMPAPSTGLPPMPAPSTGLPYTVEYSGAVPEMY